jgi:hypothetical protein
MMSRLVFRTFILAAIVLGGTGISTVAHALGVRQALAPTGADADARGKVRLQISKHKKGALRGTLVVLANKLDARSTFDVTIDGVRVGTLVSNRRGKGRARFTTVPRGSKDQLLGVDPRGRVVAIMRGGAVVLRGGLSDDSIDPSKVRCCLAHDSGAECEDRTPATCAAQGGVSLGAGSCLPNPCESATPGTDVVCCLPDDRGPECEDRTAAQCAVEGGVGLGVGACLPNPCAPSTSPGGDTRCCLPDDSGPHCEDRTATACATQGGVDIGPGACVPNPCLSGGPTTSTLPPAARVLVSCEKRAARSRVSVNGRNLSAGLYHARVASGSNTAASGPAPAIGDQVELDFDSDPGDIAQGATPIAADFIQGTPLALTAELLNAGGAVVASATVTCVER